MTEAEFQAAYRALCAELTRVCRESGRTYTLAVWQEKTSDTQVATTMPDGMRHGFLRHLANRATQKGSRDVPVPERSDS